MMWKKTDYAAKNAKGLPSVRRLFDGHRAIWQKMQEVGIDSALILEDDAIIAPEILDVLPRLEKLRGHFCMI